MCQNGTLILVICGKITYYLNMNNELKEIRTNYGISAKEAAISANIPFRTYLRYEKDDNYGNSLKRAMIINLLKDKHEITEEKGLLTIEKIRELAEPVFKKYKDEVDLCYLFGSYAKGYAKEKSDVDLCVSTTLNGFKFVGFVEELRTVLIKKVEVIRLCDIKDNEALLKEIMKDGIKIYG